MRERRARARKRDALDLGDGEAQDERPDEAEDELPPAVDDICARRRHQRELLDRSMQDEGPRACSETGRTLGPDVGQVDAHLLDAVERLGRVLDLLDAQVRLVVELAERLVRERFLRGAVGDRVSGCWRAGARGRGERETHDELDEARAVAEGGAEVLDGEEAARLEARVDPAGEEVQE